MNVPGTKLPKVPFKRVVVDDEVGELPFTRELLARLPGGMEVAHRPADADAPTGRATLWVTREPGAFVKECPCTPGVIGCGYKVFTLGFQCPFACTYCFLRFYGPDEPLTLYANLEEAAQQFKEAASRWNTTVRVGTGEFTDSLALDPWTGHSEWLAELVRDHPNVLLEFKTKSDRVEGLLALEPLENLLVAWSVNPPAAVVSDEPETASLDERLDAASRVVAAGYRVAFHFDPVILYGMDRGDWRADYRAVVRRLFEAVDPARVAWISLGTLRFPQRFLDGWGAQLRSNPVFFDEFVPGEDGKLRYFWPLRREAYRLLSDEIMARGAGRVPVYLCMESEAMWRAGLDRAPTEEALELDLCSSCAYCGVDDESA